MSFSKISDQLNSDMRKLIQNKPEEEWVERISDKDKTGKDLVRFLEAIVDHHTDRKANPALYVLADQAITQLTVRTLSKDLENKVTKLAKKVGHVGETKLNVKSLEPKYRLEAAGIELAGKVIHPHPSSKITEFAKKWENSKTSKSLEEYIEKKAPYSAKRDMKSRDVKYLTEKEREKYEVSFDKKGKVKINGHTAKKGEYMYVLDASKKELYAGKKETNKFHHSSFLAGAPVGSAGVLKVKSNGKLDKAKPSSGHYKPKKEHGENLREHLAKDTNLGKRKAEKLEIKEHKSKSHKSSSHKHSHSHKKHKHK